MIIMCLKLLFGVVIITRMIIALFELLLFYENCDETYMSVLRVGVAASSSALKPNPYNGIFCFKGWV